MKESFGILLQISLNPLSKGPIIGDTALIQTVVWYRTGEKSLPEPMMDEFTNEYMYRPVCMN